MAFGGVAFGGSGRLRGVAIGGSGHWWEWPLVGVAFGGSGLWWEWSFKRRTTVTLL